MIGETIARKFGYVKALPPPKPEDRDRLATEIASGIAYEMRWYQNWLLQYWNPNPVMRSSKWTGYHVFEEMDGDAHVAAVMAARKEALLSKRFYPRSARRGDELEDTKQALAYWNLDHIPMLHQKKREMLSAQDYGFSVTEMIFGYEDVVLPDRIEKKTKNGITTKTTIPGARLNQVLVVKDLKTKVPSAFGFDGAGDLYMVPTGSDNRTVGGAGARKLTPEEIQHFIVHTHDPRFGSRYGWPLKASFFWDYLMKKAGKLYRMIYVEKYGMPWLKGVYPPGTKAEGDGGTKKFEERLRGLQKNSWIMVPEGFAIEFVDAMQKSGTMDVYGALMNFCDGNISEVVLGHREAVSTGATGARAESEVKAGPLRQEKLEMDGADLDASFNDNLILPVMDYNFVPNGLYPWVITDVKPPAALDKLVFRFSAALNQLKVPLSLSQVREELNLREPEDDDDTIWPDPGPVPSAAAPTAGGDNEATTTGANLSAVPDFYQGRTGRTHQSLEE